MPDVLLLIAFDSDDEDVAEKVRAALDNISSHVKPPAKDGADPVPVDLQSEVLVRPRDELTANDYAHMRALGLEPERLGLHVSSEFEFPDGPEGIDPKTPVEDTTDA